MRISRYLFGLFFIFSFLQKGHTCCAGPLYTLTELLTQTKLEIFEVKIDSIGKTNSGEYLSKGKITHLYRGNPKSKTIYINSGGNSSAGGTALEVGSKYLIFSGSNDGINYNAFVCDYYSVKLTPPSRYSGNNETIKRTQLFVRQYFDAFQAKHSDSLKFEWENIVYAEGKMLDGLLDGVWVYNKKITHGIDEGQVLLKSSKTYSKGVLHGESFSSNLNNFKKIENISNYHYGKIINSESYYIKKNLARVLAARTIHTYEDGIRYSQRSIYDEKGNPNQVESNMRIINAKFNSENPIVSKEILHGQQKEYVNGILSKEGYYEQGAKVGLWMYYDDKGMLESEELLDYPEINKDTFTLYYPDGGILSKGFLKNGYMHGTWKSYTKHGMVEFVGAYIDGLLEGEVIRVDNKGKKISTSYKRGKKNGTSTSTIDNKIVSKSHYKNGQREGRFEKYKNGKIIQVENYKNNKQHGLFVTFDSNGDTLTNKTYVKGLFHGKYIQYKKNKIYEEGNYENGQRIGLWKIYKTHLNYYTIVDYSDNSSDLSPVFVGRQAKKIIKYVDINGQEIEIDEIKRREQEYRQKKKSVKK